MTVRYCLFVFQYNNMTNSSWKESILSATNNSSTSSLLDNDAQFANGFSVGMFDLLLWFRFVEVSAFALTVWLQRISSSIEMKIKNSGNVRVSFYSKCLG